MNEFDRIDLQWVANMVKRKTVDRVQKRVRQPTFDRAYQRILPELSTSGERLWAATHRRVNNFLRGSWWSI